jgi:hypothetical protein
MRKLIFIFLILLLPAPSLALDQQAYEALLYPLGKPQVKQTPPPPQRQPEPRQYQVYDYRGYQGLAVDNGDGTIYFHRSVYGERD